MSDLPVHKRHPAGLFVLFFTEMWERFSYYGMRALLVYYMTKHLLIPQAEASSIYGYYTGLVYLTPFFGGMLADRYLGQRKSVIVGAILMAIGQFMLMSEALFYPALGFLIFGNGAFKPNISTQVGNLYRDGDAKRDEAFSIFYVGINVGAFFSPLICGTIGEVYGWKYGFGSAGIGMLLGLAIYVWGQKYLANDNIMQKRETEAAAKADNREVSKEKLTKEEIIRIGALLVLCVLNILFWAVYEQQGNTLALWFDANTNRHIWGPDSWEIPATWFQSLNPFIIFLFTPVVIQFWNWQGKRQPSSIGKMAIGCLLMGLSFLFLLPPSASNEPASIWWLVACTFVLTIGELYLSPVGLSLVTKVAPKRMVSMLMGAWFLSSFFGNYLAGYLGTFWEVMPKQQFFLMLIAISLGTGIFMLIMVKPLKRAIQGDSNKDIDL